MTDTRSPDEIERDIERERNEFGQTMDELQDRFSPERIMREISRGLSEHGQDYAHAISQSVKRNPVALALTGIGLVWMMSGRSWEEDRHAVRAAMPRMGSGTGGARGTHADDPLEQYRRSGTEGNPYGRSGAEANPYGRSGAEGNPYGRSGAEAQSYGALENRPGDTVRSAAYDPAYETGTSRGQDPWLWADDDAYWIGAEDDHDDDASGTGSPGMGERLSGAGARAGTRAQEAAGHAGERTRAAARDVGDRATAARDSAAARARRIRRRLSEGTESLTEEARDRVIAARWAAIRARRAAARRAQYGADAAARFFDENPLVAGGLALAAGAILAGSLPRTRQEDDYFGAYSDNAYDRAERTFQAERQKAMKVADRAAETAQEVMAEERAKIDDQAPGEKSAAEHVTDELRSGAKRVGDAARSEAESQKLGKPGS